MGYLRLFFYISLHDTIYLWKFYTLIVYKNGLQRRVKYQEQYKLILVSKDKYIINICIISKYLKGMKKKLFTVKKMLCFLLRKGLKRVRKSTLQKNSKFLKFTLLNTNNPNLHCTTSKLTSLRPPPPGIDFLIRV